MFSWIFVAKKKKKNRTESLVLYLVEICKDFPIFISLLIKITETRFDSEPREGASVHRLPVCFFWVSIFFVVCVPLVHVNKFKLCAHLLSSYEDLVNLSISCSRFTSCIPFKWMHNNAPKVFPATFKISVWSPKKTVLKHTMLTFF